MPCASRLSCACTKCEILRCFSLPRWNFIIYAELTNKTEQAGDSITWSKDNGGCFSYYMIWSARKENIFISKGTKTRECVYDIGHPEHGYNLSTSVPVNSIDLDQSVSGQMINNYILCLTFN